MFVAIVDVYLSLTCRTLNDPSSIQVRITDCFVLLPGIVPRSLATAMMLVFGYSVFTLAYFLRTPTTDSICFGL
ncbi:hypothetical protein BO86DRAFT_384928 [Aspergillus japonicus CBS 114.51]|uniref:Uncharacterized protein n=1 Tax=Aspergillus japonicus CBS 114.51 TaxID=1448312 RepID=A0A8T8XFU6_ASPJA|nr:hypothetical protein BO86DRAFT_384928 [Aspergillus japonicus CBS 114.51]RAH86940.1 hypothetical protein BO86DRAFT_384928 [Aspergillus japonicus CBS 114.51]